MSMWSIPSDARASRIGLIMVGGRRYSRFGRARDADELTIVGWSASVT
jgi:hypothetical protein